MIGTVSKERLAGLPDTIDLDGFIEGPIQYIGKARRSTNGRWRVAAIVGGALVIVEVSISFPQATAADDGPRDSRGES